MRSRLLMRGLTLALLAGAWGAPPAAQGASAPIPPSCPYFPPLNLPGVLCESFDAERNGVPGFQWSRLPPGADPNDPLRAVGDPNDDVLGYTMAAGPSPLGTAGVICSSDNLGYAGCQAPVAEENDWHLHSPFEGPGAGYTPPGQPEIGQADGGKSHSGFRSMHMGRHFSSTTTLMDTLRFRQVSAFVLDEHPGPGIAGIIPGPGSLLEFWHIAAFLELYSDGFYPVAALGGGQVQLSSQGDDGRYTPWRTLTPSFNGYDEELADSISLCTFDPGDDQVPPDDTFCDGRPVFMRKGDPQGTDVSCMSDTDGDWPFEFNDCGGVTCAPGPGCTEHGSSGIGVWARSAFDLSPFAGRQVRLRWIATVQGGWSFATQRSALEPDPGGAAYQYYDIDDGWWLDDIVLTDLREAPFACSTADADGDGVSGCQDCDDGQGGSWAPPAGGPVLDVSVDQATGIFTLSWSEPAQPGSSQVMYDVLRSDTEPWQFDAATCLASDQTDDRTATDGPFLSGPSLSYWLVRAQNGCPGTDTSGLGARSDGTPRTGRACP